MVTRSVLIASLALMASAIADAKIVASNLTGQKLHLSFHGEGCRQFVSAEYTYPPCAARDLKVNETAVFTNILDPRGLTKNEKLVRPRMVFNKLGFAYGCRLHEFAISRVCCWHDAWFMTASNELQTPIESNESNGQDGVFLSVDKHYLLEILSDWALFPLPQMGCKVTQVIEDSALCKASPAA